jgi:hypothetical protein
VLDIKLSSYSPCLLLLNCLIKKGTCNVLQPCALPSSPPQLHFPPQSPFSCLTARSSPRSLLARLISIHWRVQRPRLFCHVITNCLFVGLETPSLLLPKSYLDFYVFLYFALPLEVNKHTNLRRIVTVRLQKKVRQGFLKAAYVKKSPVHQNNTVGVIRLN